MSPLFDRLLESARRRAHPTEGRRTLTPGQALLLAGASLGGALGLLPGVAGAMDPVTLVAWLALLAPAAGFACGAGGLRPWPFGLAVPGLWAFLVLWADLSSARDLATPLWAALVLAGFFCLGSGLGSLWPGRGAEGAGLLILAALLLAGLVVQGGMAGPEAVSWGRTHGGLAACFLELFPPGFVLDCAGWEGWTHSIPGVYALSGIEDRPRTLYQGSLFGPLVFGVGLVLGEALPRWAGRRRHLL